MPITEGTGAFNIGRDCQVVLVGPYGQVDLGNLTSFDAKQVTATIKVDRLDGVQLNAELPKGWTGSFDMERANSAVDLMFEQMESDWMTSGIYQVGTLYQYIAETGGGTTTFQFDNVSMKLTEGGMWKGDSSVKQTMSFSANRRRSV